jgi:hypothetical protein
MRVRVVQADGVTPVPGATVTFSASPAAVTFSACAAATCAVITDQQGEASSRMMPNAAGTFTITAAISPAAYVHGTLTAVSSSLDIAGAASSSWVAEGATFTLPLTVRVLSNGHPVSSRSVQYAVTQGTASLSSATTLTNASGYATTNLNVTSLAAEVHASACAMPDARPCVNFYVYVVPAGELRLQFVDGEQQIINTAQSFSPVRLRVTDSASPPNPVQAAPVTVLTGIFRFQTPPAFGGSNPPPPPAPVVLGSSQALLHSDASGMLSLTPSAESRFGAVLVRVIAFAGSGTPLQFELQRLWAPAGWVASTATVEQRTAAQPRPLRRRTISSPRYLPTD